jgi:CheY-like chemotaxis protein
MLIVEPHFVMRRTLVYTVQELGLADVTDATNVEQGRRQLELKPFHLLIIDVEPPLPVLDLIADIRAGKTASRPDLRIIATLPQPHAATELRLQELQVTDLLRKPYRAKDVLHALARPRAMASQPA